MVLPDRITEAPLDDTQSIELDLENLFSKFILPIERLRSFSAPILAERPIGAEDNIAVSKVANTANIDPSEPQESRAHAFYRMIGLPVIGSSLDFFNPGFDPTLNTDDRVKNANIASNISQIVKLMHSLRETNARSRLSIFKRQGVDASVFAVATGVPNGTKPFLQMDPSEGFDSLNQKDEQKYLIKTRRDYIRRRYVQFSGADVNDFFEAGTHILRPFNVDPNIADTVVGFANETRMVAVPFLQSKKDTGIERNIFTKRPGIEFILRLRLKQQEVRTASEEAAFILEQFDETDITTSDLRSTVSALLDQAVITDVDIQNRLRDASAIEVLNINKLIKTIKGVINILIQSVDNISDISRKIKWTPLPNERGPEFGSETANFIRQIQQTELERRIINLELRAQDAKRQGELSDNPEIIGRDFHLSEFENTEKVFNDRLSDAKEERDRLQVLGNDSLAAIEVITGEVSGLGLIDVLAIYTALWAIDIEVLISMLDDRAFDRLYRFNPDLRTFDVELRRSSGPQLGINEAMQTFERQIINILSYSDKIFQQKLGSPTNFEGGTVSSVGS